jgi:cytochrome b6-f complex iron-sulfur subunit
VLTRRELAALALAAAAPLTGCGDDAKEDADEAWYDVGAFADVSEDWERRAFIAQGLDASVHVRRDGERLLALADTCTHKSCPVRWVNSTRRFICPCHGAIFGPRGRPIAGPAKAPLMPLRVRVRGARVQVALPILPLYDTS